MKTIKIKTGSTKMVAHRGVSGLEKENTCAAFVAAGNRSYFGVECDIHRTSDGRYVVIHDSDCGRVAGEAIDVEKSTFSLVRQVKLLDFNGEKRGDLVIPSLEEYVSICKKYGKKCILEIKGVFEFEWISEVVDIIRGMDYLEDVIFIAYDLINLQHLHKIVPGQSAQLLVGEWREDIPQILLDNNLGLDIHYSGLNDERVALLHNLDIEVNCWTVDNAEDGERLCKMGVDYITSNILE